MVVDGRKLSYIFILGLVLLLLAVFDAYIESAREIVITRTDKGFEPEVISIKKGQTVKFVTDTGEPFWPASDSHPTHGKYPEFDPTIAIPTDESWKFTFYKAGVWKFHDHLNSQFTGKILVIGEEGESTKNCLEGRASDGIQAECWEAELAEVINEEGAEAGFDAFKVFYDGDALFRRNCHDVTHYIGNIAYRQFEEADKTIIREETSFCGFGFYHGFIEAALIDKGPSFYKTAHNYCDSLSTNPAFKNGSPGNAVGACIHGFGHAILDSVEGRYWGDDSTMVKKSIDICEKTFADDWSRESCGSGVYNSLAIAYNNNFYLLKFNESNPMKICDDQEELYRNRCYMEVGIHFVNSHKFTENEILSFIRNLDYRSGAIAMIYAFADDSIRYNISDFNAKKAHNVCLKFTVQEEIQSCIKGTLLAVRFKGIREKDIFALGQEFCNLFAKESSNRLFCEQKKRSD